MPRPGKGVRLWLRPEERNADGTRPLDACSSLAIGGVYASPRYGREIKKPKELVERRLLREPLVRPSATYWPQLEIFRLFSPPSPRPRGASRAATLGSIPPSQATA
jgi:hypothetical protein